MDAIVGLSGVLVAWFVLTIAGYLVARAWGAGGATGLLSAMPVSFGIIGSFALVQDVTQVRFTLLSVGWAYLMVALLGWSLMGALAFLGRTSGRRRSNTLPLGYVFTLFGTIMLATTVMVIAAGGTLETSPQTFDVAAHANTVRWITESGQASPWHAHDFLSPSVGGGYYPSGFSSVSAVNMLLLGSDAVFASNVTAILLAGALWPSAMMLLCRCLLGTSGRLVPLCGLLSLGLWGMPWAGLGWGVVWPTVASSAFAPIAVLGSASLLGLSANRMGRIRSLVVIGVGLALVSLSHPRGLSLTLPVFAVMWVVFLFQKAAQGRRQRRPSHVRLAALGLVLTAAAVVGLFALVQLSTNVKIVAINWPVTETFWGALGGYLINGPNGTVPGIAVMLLMLVGMWRSWLQPVTRWIPIAYVVLVLLDVATSTVRNDALGAITQFWYNDRYRSAAMAPLAGVLLAAIGARYLWELLATRQLRPRATRLIAAGGVVILATTSLIGPTVYLSDWYIGLSRDPRHNLVSPSEVAFFNVVAATVPPDDIILNNPLDGSALIYAYVNRRLAFYVNPTPATPYSRHLAVSLVTNTDHALVCKWFTESHIGWVYNGGVTYSTFATTPSPAPGMVIPDGFWATTLVAESGDAKLYQVTGCG